MKNFILGIAASIIAGIILVLVQPFLPSSPLSNFLELIQSTKMRLSEAYSSKVFRYAAAGYGEGTVLLALMLGVFAFLAVSVFFASSIKESTSKKSTSLDKILAIISVSLFLVIALVLTNEITVVGSAIDLDKSHQRRLVILAPHISVQEERELRATWALIKDRNSYERINNKLDALAQMNGVTLPDAYLEKR
jgi:hypothetical protein